MSLSSDERVHGGIDPVELSKLGIEAARVIDFSVNLNPYGPSEAVARAAREAPLDRYPDPKARSAREAWARALDTAPERIVVGHGAAELMWAIARAFLRPSDRVAIAEPTFSELRIAAGAMHAEVERVFTPDASTLRFDLDLLRTRAQGARMLYLCSPNNPTGEHIPASRLAELACALPDTLHVIDQSFLSLSDHAEEERVALPDNVICVRSLTKDFALAGLRIGYAVAARPLAERIETSRPTWATSAPALSAIEQAARERAFVAHGFRRMRIDREYLRRSLVELGLAPLPSATSYQLLQVPDACRLRADLLARGLLVRDCTSFGLPQHVRLAARPPSDVQALIAGLREVLGKA